MVVVCFVLSRAYYSTNSVPPDNPCPIRFRWRSMTRVHENDHIGGSKQWLGALRSQVAMISAARSSSPRLSPGPSLSGRCSADPRMVSPTISDWSIGSDSKHSSWWSSRSHTEHGRRRRRCAVALSMVVVPMSCAPSWSVLGCVGQRAPGASSFHFLHVSLPAVVVNIRYRNRLRKGSWSKTRRTTGCTHWLSITMMHFFVHKNSFFAHNRFSTVFFSMTMAESEKIFLASCIIDFGDIQVWLSLFSLSLKAFLICAGPILKKTIITLQALRLKLNCLNQTSISSKSIMKLTKTIFWDSVTFIEKKRVENRL